MSAERKKMIHILIADDFKVLRDVIRLYLEQAEDMDVLDEAPDLNQALKSAKALHPDVVIMNDYLPPIDSAHAAAHFRELGFTAAILIISMHLEPGLIQGSLLSGANGFIHKEKHKSRIGNLIRLR